MLKSFNKREKLWFKTSGLRTFGVVPIKFSSVRRRLFFYKFIFRSKFDFVTDVFSGGDDNRIARGAGFSAYLGDDSNVSCDREEAEAGRIQRTSTSAACNNRNVTKTPDAGNARSELEKEKKTGGKKSNEKETRAPPAVWAGHGGRNARGRHRRSGHTVAARVFRLRPRSRAAGTDDENPLSSVRRRHLAPSVLPDTLIFSFSSSVVFETSANRRPWRPKIPNATLPTTTIPLQTPDPTT